MAVVWHDPLVLMQASDVDSAHIPGSQGTSSPRAALEHLNGLLFFHFHIDSSSYSAAVPSHGIVACCHFRTQEEPQHS